MEGKERGSYYERYVSGWNTQNLEQVMAQLADDFSYIDPATDGPIAQPEIEQHFEDILNGFPDIHFEDHIIKTRKNAVLVSRWKCTGTHSGTYLRFPPTGNSLVLDGVSIYTIGNDGITQIDSFFDQNTVRRQLGFRFPDIIEQIPKIACSSVAETLNRKLASDD